MSKWTHGYDISLGYTHGFYREMAPDWLDMCARLSGYLVPDRGADGKFRYLDMGCGQGFGLCLLAAANPDGEFVGIDFMPEHVVHATRLAAAGGLTNVRFVEADFAQLALDWPADLGLFDYVVMHGICSWIPDPVRAALMRCLEQAVVPGGFVYNSYNTLPGWASTMPFRHMARRMLAAGGKTSSAAAIGGTLKMFEKMEQANTAMFRALPTLKSRLASIRDQKNGYLVQEYMHEAWRLFWFSEMIEEMKAAKLSYIGTATVAEQMLPGVLDPSNRAIIEDETDPVYRQEVQDCVINQSFRRDLMCRGGQKVFANPFEQVKPIVLQLVKAPKEDQLTIPTSFGELTLKREFFGPVVNALTDGPMTIGALMDVPAIQKQGVNAAIQSMMLLVQHNAVSVARQTKADAGIAQRFNAALARAVCEGAPYGQVAVPTLGSGLSIPDSDFMLLDAWLERPGCDARTLGKGLVARLKRLGRRLSEDGKALDESAHAQRVEALANAFLKTTVLRWRKAGVIA